MSKAKTKPKPPTSRAAFLVARTAFMLGYGASLYRIHGIYDDEPRVVPVRAFATRKAAEAFARVQDEEALATLSPPQLAELIPRPTDRALGVPPHDPLEQVAATLEALGLPPLPPARRGSHFGRPFHEWWAEHAKDLSAAQKAALWGPFAGMTFHYVREIEVEG